MSGGEPAWFQAAFNRAIEPIKIELRRELGKTMRICALSYNETCGTGDAATLYVVPFENGEYPTEPPHNLPALTSPKIVRELNVNEANSYYKGYGLPGWPPLEHRIAKILHAIGCGPPPHFD
ncbi:hypothetical protein D9615_003137 [Tricholomella constricta]|uniref:Mug135-like C-terminal domain-containing protein n=1 Tax=Tricholomella constricta TaxID=117010 RepID=A0A8H5M845_9AGAR|nr:hypothetical protein D9615_003137 [Tricholomella constricta]